MNTHDKSEATRLADALERFHAYTPACAAEDRARLDQAIALLRRWPDGEPVEGWLKPWETARFGVFLPDGSFEELPASDPVGEKHQCGHTARWVGGQSDLQLLRAALRAAPPAESERIAALEAENQRLRGIVPEVLEKLNDELCKENEALKEALEQARGALEWAQTVIGRPDDSLTADVLGDALRAIGEVKR